jgi:magnesium transporter
VATIQLCFDGEGSRIESDFDDLHEVLATHPSLVWIDLDIKERDTLQKLGEQLDLHQLAVDSALLENERPQVTVYDDMIFVEFYGLRENGTAPELDEISFFVGSNYLITVRNDDSPGIDSVFSRWQDERHQPRHVSSGMLLYALLDEIVDGYFPMVDALGDRIEDLEERLMEDALERPQFEIHEVRKELLRLRRVLAPQREVLNKLIRRDVPMIDEDVEIYMSDVYDHMLRVLDWLDAYRDMLTTLFDVQLAMQSHRLDRVIRTLTSSSIMLMVATLIAGIYGMNFVHMPELEWTIGYPLALLMMMVSSVGLYFMFKRRGWI